MAVNFEVTVVTPKSGVSENEKTTHVVEVVKKKTSPTVVDKRNEAIDINRPGGTVVSISAGTQLPEHPYEGQVFILL